MVFILSADTLKACKHSPKTPSHITIIYCACGVRPPSIVSFSHSALHRAILTFVIWPLRSPIIVGCNRSTTKLLRNVLEFRSFPLKNEASSDWWITTVLLPTIEVINSRASPRSASPQFMSIWYRFTWPKHLFLYDDWIEIGILGHLLTRRSAANRLGFVFFIQLR